MLPFGRLIQLLAEGKTMSVPSITLTDGGPTFSRLVLGLWRLMQWRMSSDDLLALIHASLALGITTFDHADIYGDYGCEAQFGAALAAEPGLRDRLQLVTKCGIKLLSTNGPAQVMTHYDTSKAHIIASAERSLRLLHTDYLDLLLIHRPDPLMDADETAAAFTELRQAGKVRHFGVSNFTPWQYDLLASRLDFPLVTNQIEFSPLHLEPLHDGVLDQCQRLRIAPMAWSPMGGARLFTADTAQANRVRHALGQVGEEVGGASLAQVTLAWILAHPARILPVLGTGKIERVRDAADSVALSLSREQWFTIWSASTGTGVP
jgi:predicted oxidoreductase